MFFALYCPFCQRTCFWKTERDYIRFESTLLSTVLLRGGGLCSNRVMLPSWWLVCSKTPGALGTLPRVWPTPCNPHKLPGVQDASHITTTHRDRTSWPLMGRQHTALPYIAVKKEEEFFYRKLVLTPVLAS